jgi:hypothetical protein
MNSKFLPRIVRTTVMSLVVVAAMSASAQMVNQTRPYSGTTSNPCNGESVVFSGSIHFHEKTQIAADGRIHFVSQNTFNASGVGQSTRANYNIGGTMKSNSKFPTYPITFRQRSRFVSTSSAAPSFHATYAFHVNGGGLQTNVTMSSDCNG